MKRVFPLIVLLITLSVLGIMFIQMHWIQSAIYVKKEIHKQNIANSVKQIRETMYTKYFQKTVVGYVANESDRLYKLRDFSVMAFSEDDVKTLIDTILKKNELKEKYEYCITNIFDQCISVSNG